MSDERKNLDPADLRRLGLLQEANRHFFHPLGLALSVRVIETDWTEREVAKSPWMKEKVDTVARVIEGWDLSEGPNEDPYEPKWIREMALGLCSTLWPKGSTHLADVWDSREDPEGFVFDEVHPEHERAVDELRRAHWRARCQIFGNEYALYERPEDDLLPEDPPDVQPRDWKPSEPAEAE